ncbi:SAM-dependent methyltransferase [Arthrobacter stackebrandtii]|nr:SAM-dependent methyltransferase [Arthrobacter stackebrandtii]
MYRLGLTPWERYGERSREQIVGILEREKPRRHGRALDIGCGRGKFTPVLARIGWDATGLDYVPAAIAAAKHDAGPGRGNVPRYVVGDATTLSTQGLGTFDLFVDIGCIQGFNPGQRQLVGHEVTASANPGARLLMLAFGPSRFQGSIGGVAREDIETAFPRWSVSPVEEASPTGLGWPMNRTAPMWYRLELDGG